MSCTVVYFGIVSESAVSQSSATNSLTMLSLAAFDGHSAKTSSASSSQSDNNCCTSPFATCVDTRGFGDTPKTNESLWVHTCKDGMWNLDMRFAWSAAGTELIMPQYEICLAAINPMEGAEITLENFGAREAKWVWENARLKLGQDPDLCLTIVKGRSEMTPGGRKFPPKYRWRGLSLEPCTAEAIERQLWTMSQPVQVEKPILPPVGSLTD